MTEFVTESPKCQINFSLFLYAIVLYQLDLLYYQNQSKTFHQHSMESRKGRKKH